MAFENSHGAHGSEQTQPQPDGQKARAFLQKQPDDSAATGPNNDANGDLALALFDGVARHAINPKHRKKGRENSEARKDRSEKTCPRPQPILADDRRGGADHDIGFESGGRGADTLLPKRQRLICPHVNGSETARRLQEWQVKVSQVRVLVALPDITNHTDDCPPGTERRTRQIRVRFHGSYLCTDRAAIGPELPRQRFTDDRHRLGPPSVVSRELASELDRHVINMEITGAD